MKYVCGAIVFETYAEAVAYSNYMYNQSGIILGIEEIK